jgi:hypothetical protein
MQGFQVLRLKRFLFFLLTHHIESSSKGTERSNNHQIPLSMLATNK